MNDKFHPHYPATFFPEWFPRPPKPEKRPKGVPPVRNDEAHANQLLVERRNLNRKLSHVARHPAGRGSQLADDLRAGVGEVERDLNQLRNRGVKRLGGKQ